MKEKFLFKLYLIFVPLLFVFGNYLMQYTFLGIPINEFLLILLFIFNIKYIIKSNYYKTLKYLISSWLVVSLLLLLIGFLSYGIVAGRDATGQLDILLLLILICYPYKPLTISNYEKIIFIILFLKIFDRFILKTFFNLSFGEFGLSVFGGTIGINIIIISAFSLGIIKYNASGKYKLLLLGSLLLVISAQNRYLYISLMIIVVYFLLIKVLLFKKVILSLIVFSLILSLVSGKVSLGSGNSAFKYGGIPTITSIIEHLNTSFGEESEIYSGSSDGLSLRTAWWSEIIYKAANSETILLFGQGFGIPLTSGYDYKIIREPHNSYLSVFARGGIFYFLIWLYIMISIFKTLQKSIKRVGTSQNETTISLIGVTILISTLTMAIVQPAFELPPVATGTYFFIGIALNYINYENNIRKKSLFKI